ncbi:MAG: 3-phosphoshikimate 1-carboxyvinyltransferase [Ktedonobacterales bacterium]|nr:3-phosphoshikimate 1-carboxyvinyltransferase [Ktedonobacterales bacterium]
MLRIAGSKYYTLRYLLVALLAEGESLVRGPAISEDTAVLVRALRALGASAEWEPDGAGWALRVRGVAGRPQVPAGGVLAMGNAGAVLRLLLGLGALLPTVRFETDHPASLGRRPNSDLLTALATLGLQVEAQGTDGLLPITLRGGPLRGGPPRGGAVSVSGARSSQYLSALLYLAPLLPLGLEITVSGDLRSTPLVRATLRVLAAAGITLEAAPDLRRFRVPGGQRYRAGVYDVPGDAPSAAALLAAALALRAPLRLAGLAPDAEDARALLGALAALGAPLAWQSAAGGGTASGDPVDGTSASTAPGSVLTLAVADLQGAVIDGDALIDSIPALAAAACFATGRSRFENVATLRLKESDRIGDLCAELRHAGGDAEPLPDAIAVCGQPEGIAGGAEVEGHDDHRLVQALAVAALRSRAGLFISGAEAVAKSYPTFFDDLTRLGARVEEA